MTKTAGTTVDLSHVKAGLAEKIGEIIRQRRLTQQQAAEILSISQPKVSNLLRGNYHGISEIKMIECLNLLGVDVRIVMSHPSGQEAAGRTVVITE